jgi:hypothetical protein
MCCHKKYFSLLLNFCNYSNFFTLLYPTISMSIRTHGLFHCSSDWQKNGAQNVMLQTPDELFVSDHDHTGSPVFKCYQSYAQTRQVSSCLLQCVRNRTVWCTYVAIKLGMCMQYFIDVHCIVTFGTLCIIYELVLC